MYKTIEIKNLRAITDLTLNNLGNVNVFVGKNNCGKTSVLEAIFLLIGCTNPNLPISINSFRGLHLQDITGWNSFFNGFRTNRPIAIKALSDEDTDSEELLIEPYFASSGRVKTTDLENGFDHQSTSFATRSNEIIGLKYNFKDSLGEYHESSIFIRNEELIPEKAKKEISKRKGIFVPCFIQTDYRARFSHIQQEKQEGQIVELLQTIEDTIIDIVLNDVGILMVDVGLKKRIPINLLGQGILKFLGIALAMLDAKDGIVLVDEIDNGLHHSIQKHLWKAIFEWANKLNVQVFATTHSYECTHEFAKFTLSETDLFKKTTEAKLFRIERENDLFTAVEFDANKIKRFVEQNWELR